MKRALLVGIDAYDGEGDLDGCVNDVTALQPLFARNEDGAPNFEVVTLLSASPDGRVDRDQLLEAIKDLFRAPADQAVFYFAGHGVKEDEDVVLMTTDASDQTPGVAFSQILSIIQRCPVREVTVILDCCFAGGAGSVPVIGAAAVMRNGLAILASSRSSETSAETPAGRGAFSAYLEGAMEGGASEVTGEVTVAGAYAYLSEAFGAWEQRPTFKANLDRLQPLRKCRPPVGLDILRRFPEWFPNADSVFPLDPGYEYTQEPRDDEKERIFQQLQRCVSAKLVEPVGVQHMYWAAMQGTGCRLTALGRRYHRLASQGRL